MTSKKRKPLDDALAREFVYGQQEQPVSETQPEPPEEPQPEPQPTKKSTSTQKLTKPNIMSQLQQTNSKEPTIRLTVDLSESMHRKLSVLAAKTNRKKAEIVRFLLDEALKDIDD
ncbi:MAG: CopG family transcriptional regulator [Trichormus sp. ATA11-4-KO1]|jgi:outer membrane biosynthesis protein TonB|nr:CopG family transcriptional regulator [Trichormus sp. ATA11-4-KO1]